jgi:DNA repair protein SbcD/Mre11
MFKFLHAADLHLDSPLRGLDRYEGAPVERIRTASRAALARFVQLALDEKVSFVLLAGDLYDGDWDDYNTGLFFIGQMNRLRGAGIHVIAIAGNHDAANKMTRSLRMPDHVTILGSSAPESFRVPGLDVVVHGQSFATAAVVEDLSLRYPAAQQGLVNIGMLHTCATGQEGHERYAPCTIDGLRARGYDYWALGHIHQRQILCSDPFIIFPGNLQGRHIREIGPKGCMLVTVDDRRRFEAEFRRLDVATWHVCSIDVATCANLSSVLDEVGASLTSLLESEKDPDRLLAVRIEVVGASPCHALLRGDPEKTIREIQGQALSVDQNRLWLEDVRIHTTSPLARDRPEEAAGAMETLRAILSEVAHEGPARASLAAELSALRKKLGGAFAGALGDGDLADPAWFDEALAAAAALLQFRLTDGEARG